MGRVTKKEGRKKGGAEPPRREEFLAQSDRIPGFADHPVKVFTALLFLTQPTFVVPKRYRGHCEAGASVYMLASWRQSLVRTQPQ